MPEPIELLIPRALRERWAAELPSEPVTVEHLGKFVRGRQINPRTLARLIAVEAELERWRAVGAKLDPDPCADLLGRGGCDIHGVAAGYGPCPYGEIRSLRIANGDPCRPRYPVIEQ